MSPDHNNSSEAMHQEMIADHLNSIDSGINAQDETLLKLNQSCVDQNLCVKQRQDIFDPNGDANWGHKTENKYTSMAGFFTG